MSAGEVSRYLDISISRHLDISFFHLPGCYVYFLLPSYLDFPNFAIPTLPHLSFRFSTPSSSFSASFLFYYILEPHYLFLQPIRNRLARTSV
ncbi:hypothetical protein F4778DRAFT_510905 [Xylariomycetidae sp. FL2044]|nr:hypothetical protein F4778DRAFT_510905 [Xylariomycetidae sp. FL2044]